MTYLLASCIRLLRHRNALFYFFLSFPSRFPVSLFTFPPFPCLSFFPHFLFSSLSFLLIFLLSFCFVFLVSYFFRSFFISLSFLYLSFLSILTFSLLSLSLSFHLSLRFFFFSHALFLSSSNFLPLSQLFLYPSVLSLVSLFMSLGSFLEATLVWRELAQNSRCSK